MLYPLTFQPILKERVWGGRQLEGLFNKPLPPGVPIGESWEISDRPDDMSVIAAGPLAGKSLRWLMENHRAELLGASSGANGAFPLLVKILDARETLSLQVHPPKQIATRLGGQPKTEMWYVAGASPRAELFVGFKEPITRQQFEAKLRDGSVADCFHRVQVKLGDAMFVPSGRVHAIGGGCVLFEIQQNSDTTYRVFDWNRLGLDGRPRELHVAQSLECIDFSDVAPGLISALPRRTAGHEIRALVDDPLFRVEVHRLSSATIAAVLPDRFSIVGVVSGKIAIRAGGAQIERGPGEFSLIPASVAEKTTILARQDSEYLTSTCS